MFSPRKSLIAEIQSEALSRDSSVTNLLMKAKAAAFKLDLKTEQAWINHELNGYNGILVDDYPQYRQIHGSVKAWNPFHGWITVQFEDNNLDLEHIMSRAPIGQNISSIEESVSGEKKNQLMIVTMDSIRKNFLTKHMNMPFDTAIHVSRGQIFSILDAVKALILDWSLVLERERERERIMGEGMAFSRNEKEKASQATTQIFANNIGTLGDVSGQAQVSNTQLSVDIPMDRSSVKLLLNQIADNIDQLPAHIRGDILEYTKSIDIHNDNNESIRRKLISIKSICEGITGSLIASGIISSLTTILG